MIFKGAGTALVTPFNINGEVDYNSLKKILQFQTENKIDAVILLGTTGESPVISSDERKKIIETGKEFTGRTKIIIGTGTNDPKKVIEYNKIAEDYGVDAVLIVNPYYNKGTQESLVEYYKYISGHTSLPIILYNVPSRTGMNLLPETIVKIHSECRNVAAIKEASGNISQIAHLFSIKPESLTVYSGNDDQTLPIMALGGAGVVSVFSNAYPSEMKTLTGAMLNNDIAKAQELNNRYLKMMNLLFAETSPSPVKFVMNQLGLCENILRLPMIPVANKTEKLLTDEMNNLKVVAA
jgi:4-hydroxy-tetrahydrodipicolinate synthase